MVSSSRVALKPAYRMLSPVPLASSISMMVPWFRGGTISVTPPISLKWPVHFGLDPRTLFALGVVDNFGDVEIDVRGLTAKIVGVAGAVRFTDTIAPAGAAPR